MPLNRDKIRRAYYIKLGRGGEWAAQAIEEGLLRLGWGAIPLLDIHSDDWETIRARLEEEHANKGTVTTDLGRLRDIATSTSEDVWITFHDSHLWWGRPSDDRVEEDSTSKYRRLIDGWSKLDAAGDPLVISRVPGGLAQLQGFRGTVCSVRDLPALDRLINAEASPAYQALEQSLLDLEERVQSAIRALHWKDFEVLVDLVFRQAGWRRRSMLGETMKYVDLELVEPITSDAYQVQVKSRASLADFQGYVDAFSGEGFRRLYFVVHSPSKDLQAVQLERDDVELVLGDQLARWIVEAGLVRWVLDKVR